MEIVQAKSCLAATTLFTSSRQGNPLGKEHVDSVRPFGFSSNGPQGKDHLCSVSGDVACYTVSAKRGLS